MERQASIAVVAEPVVAMTETPASRQAASMTPRTVGWPAATTARTTSSIRARLPLTRIVS